MADKFNELPDSILQRFSDLSVCWYNEACSDWRECVKFKKYDGCSLARLCSIIDVYGTIANKVLIDRGNNNGKV